MTELYTDEFIETFNKLNKLKYPNSHNSAHAYAYLVGLLSSCIENRRGVKYVQQQIDEREKEFLKELSDLYDKVN